MELYYYSRVFTMLQNPRTTNIELQITNSYESRASPSRAYPSQPRATTFLVLMKLCTTPTHINLIGILQLNASRLLHLPLMISLLSSVLENWWIQARLMECMLRMLRRFAGCRGPREFTEHLRSCWISYVLVPLMMWYIPFTCSNLSR